MLTITRIADCVPKLAQTLISNPGTDWRNLIQSPNIRSRISKTVFDAAEATNGRGTVYYLDAQNRLIWSHWFAPSFISCQEAVEYPIIGQHIQTSVLDMAPPITGIVIT